MIRQHEALQMPLSLAAAFPTGAVGVVVGAPVETLQQQQETELSRSTNATQPEAVVLGQPRAWSYSDAAAHAAPADADAAVGDAAAAAIVAASSADAAATAAAAAAAAEV